MLYGRRVTSNRKISQFIFTLAVIVVAYFGIGKLSFLLAIPPSYAAPIFPPAGIALASLLLGGNRLWPGIWLGAFWLNISAGSASHLVLFPAAISLAAGIGTEASIQAIVGSFLIRQFVSLPSPLVRPSDIVKFLFLGGPVACLVGATLSVICLMLGKVLSLENYPYAWWNWWIGDTIGVFVFTPLLLILFSKPREIWSRRRFTVAIPLGLIFLLNTVILIYVGSREHKRIELRFELAASGLVDRVRKSIDGYLDSLYALESILVGMPHENRNAFQLATRRWFSIYPGIRDLSWSPRVVSNERRIFEAQAREMGMANFVISAPNSRGELKASAPKDEYYPTLLIAPERDTDILGFDQNSSDERRTAMNRARDSDEIATSAPVQRMQVKSVAPDCAFMVYIPVYRGAHDTLENRRKNIRGFGKAVFRVDDIIEAATNKEFKHFFRLNLYDGEPSRGKSLYAEISGPASFIRQSKIMLANRALWIQISPRETYLEHQRDVGPWTVLGSMLIMSGLFVALFLTFTGNSFAVEKQLFERKRITEKLVKTNAELVQFAYVASHDLQEPLRMVSSYVQLIQKRLKGNPDREISEFMEFAIDGSRRMQGLIKDLLEYSRVGRRGEHRQNTELNKLLTMVLKDLSFSIKESAAEIEVGELPNLDVLRTEWVQLFQNLIGNALKYRDEARGLRIEISARRENSYWLFSIKDNGIGIPDDALDRIFLVFQRLHDRTRYPGTGMGLAICKKIIEGHRGTIWVESIIGRGSKFNFLIPA